MKIKKVYLGQRQIYPDEPRTPGANTVLYIKWAWDVNDYSVNSVSTTAVNVAYNTEWSLTYINLTGSTYNGIRIPSISITKPITYSVWIYPRTGWSSSPRFLEQTSWSTYFLRAYRKSNWQIVLNNDVSAYMTMWTWNHVVITVSWTTAKVYINGTQAYSWSYSTNGTSWNWSIWYKSSNNDDYMDAKLSNIIIESSSRTAEEVSTYFNKTKSLYGIS